MNIFNAVLNFIRAILDLFSKSSAEKMNADEIKIFVKCGSDMVPVSLDSKWTIYDLKKDISAKLCMKVSELRIIFAGKELHDSIRLEDCDVGDQSVIHVVKNRKQTINLSVEENCSPQLNFCSSAENRENENSKSKKPHFFVYCDNPCKSLSPGKLRVRCSKCHEGTLTVNKDPSCWDDVLIPGRITGVCQSENCNGSVAEFFFKCAKHASRESSVPLYLIKNNFKNIPCIACTDIRDIVLVFPCEDGHVICLECFEQYCITFLNERKFVLDKDIGYSIDCPARCPDSVIKEPHHFKLLGHEQYSRYQRFGAEECLLQSGGVLCPQPGCGAGLLPDPECRRVVCSLEGGVGCGFVFCRHCLQGYHIGECDSTEVVGTQQRNSYSISDQRASTSKWDEDSRNTIKITTKPCPKCRTPTERDGGCMHMVCTRSQCGFHWCWVCQEEWTRDCMGDHWFG